MQFTPGTDLNILYLAFALKKLDLLLERVLFKWRIAGQKFDDPYRGMVISDESADQFLQQPAFGNWGSNIGIPAEKETGWLQQYQKIELAIQQTEQQARDQNVNLRLAMLAEKFNLTPLDSVIFLLAAAPALDLRYEKIFAYVQDDITRKAVSINLVLAILTENTTERNQVLGRFTRAGPLQHHLLIHPFKDETEPSQSYLSQPLKADESIVKWLTGHYEIPSELSDRIHLEPSPALNPAQQALLNTRSWQSPQDINDIKLIILHGPDLQLRRAIACRMAVEQNKALLEIRFGGDAGGPINDVTLLQHGLRDAALLDAVPLIVLDEGFLNHPDFQQQCYALLAEHAGLVILSADRDWRIQQLAQLGNAQWYACPLPDTNARRSLWAFHLQQCRAEANIAVENLAAQFELPSQHIQDICRYAAALAHQEKRSLTEQDLLQAACLYSSGDLEKLARRVHKRHTWQDLILPPDQIEQLKEIVATVRQRPRVLEDWGLGKKLVSSAGISALFSGPPGTGKTMSAEVIAHELGLELFKIDLSTVVSKYIGETEKNLETIFVAAESSNAILFFDEADSLFGKRSEVKEAHDRYANIEISYLLQRMEAYNGLAILATNMRANLDEAFLRRLHFIVDLPFPTAEYRQRIWEVLFPATVPRGPQLDFAILARRHRFSGGNIRNVIIAAAYLAAENGGIVTMQHLLHGTRRELQKIGRLIDPEEKRDADE